MKSKIVLVLIFFECLFATATFSTPMTEIRYDTNHNKFLRSV